MKRIEEIIKNNQKKMKIDGVQLHNVEGRVAERIWEEFGMYSVSSQNPQLYKKFAQELGDYILYKYNLSRRDFQDNLETYENTQRIIDSMIKSYDEE